MGMVIMAIGASGIIVSTIFEIITKEPAYAIMMKVFPLCFAIGCFIWARRQK